jgi:phosphoglycolate phosphatase
MRKKYKNLVFDLDGTISNPEQGIYGGIRYALNKMGVDISPQEDLSDFIGPVLLHSFQSRYFSDPVEASEAVNHYRGYYTKTGLFENKVYEKISELLLELKEHYRLFVLTNKPKPFAVRILDHFGLSANFIYIAGPDLGDRSASKSDLVPGMISLFPFLLPETTLMIGDTPQDIQCSRTCGWDMAAVTWGFGKEEEFSLLENDRIFHKVNDLRAHLLP